ncbi:hypothetical protein O181_075791, partial [Austropuccinia psidii MF-1]|nr:hypothetical protein [Austropuccinia psidii MF-1]
SVPGIADANVEPATVVASRGVSDCGAPGSKSFSSNGIALPEIEESKVQENAGSHKLRKLSKHNRNSH